MVIGAGPGGLEAARAAACQGHRVVVYEKNNTVGGQLNLIRKRPTRQGMAAVISYLKQQLEALGVPLLTDQTITKDRVLEENPEVVIVATGSFPNPKPVPGRYGPPAVLTVWEVLEGHYPLGERILFIDENSGHHATATVELLADQGKHVDMITSDLFVGVELAPLGDLYLTRQRLLQKGVTFTTEVLVDEIQGTTVRGRDIYTNQPRVWEGYGTIVLDLGNIADDRLYRELKGQVKELHRVGDCQSPRGIDTAIFEGRKVGQSL
jgi:thioredoxin reductase